MRTSKIAMYAVWLLAATSLVFWHFQWWTFDGYTLHMTSVEAGIWAIVILLLAISFELEDD
jgi:hypothetical protein